MIRYEDDVLVISRRCPACVRARINSPYSHSFEEERANVRKNGVGETTEEISVSWKMIPRGSWRNSSPSNLRLPSGRETIRSKTSLETDSVSWDEGLALIDVGMGYFVPDDKTSRGDIVGPASAWTTPAGAAGGALVCRSRMVFLSTKLGNGVGWVVIVVI